MRILVTRPEVDARPLAEELVSRGHQPVVAPLLEIVFSTQPLPAKMGEAQLVFTSANGVRSAKARNIAPALPVYVVGRATESAAREAGYAIAGTAQSSVDSLVALIAGEVKSPARIVHVSGTDIAGDLCGDLRRGGFFAERFVAYEARAVPALPVAARSFLTGEPGAVLLFSPRSATVLVDLMTREGLADCAAQHRALALSTAVAQQARNLSWRSVEVAATPESSELLALL